MLKVNLKLWGGGIDVCTTQGATHMNQAVHNIWSIADDCLRDVYVRGKYCDVILPNTPVKTDRI